MLLKTFQGADLATALALARQELGPDALVLATREIQAGCGGRGVEVTVGSTRREDARPASLEESAVTRLAREVDELRRLLREPPAPPHPGAGDPPDACGGIGPVHVAPSLRAAVEVLRGSGVSPDLAERFARIATRGLGSSPEPQAIVEAAERGVSALVPFAPLPVRGRCLFVVGPPGAGKTVTVAKLAARLTLASNGSKRRVIFAEADSDRVGAIEQARLFSTHIGTTLVPIDDGKDLRRCLGEAGREGTVVVDTPGIASADRDRMALLEDLRATAPEESVAVLLPAGLHHEEASRVLDRFAPLRPTCVGFSRTDDGHRLGELITALQASQLPLAFLTTGHRVPQDLHGASARSLASLLLRGTAPVAPSAAPLA